MIESLSALPLPRAADGRIALAVDVSPWRRSDAPTGAERLFVTCTGGQRAPRSSSPGWPYSFVASLESGRTSWTAMLDAIRLRPEDDAYGTVTACRDRLHPRPRTWLGHEGELPILGGTDPAPGRAPARTQRPKPVYGCGPRAPA
ncbi:transposase [Nocardia aurea]|uniref:transposase n=1 Tax=Nocardia aurea TaxID=2144174 RepID=UPI0018E5743E|nr:transposase [Nocardia aurea]